MLQVFKRGARADINLAMVYGLIELSGMIHYVFNVGTWKEILPEELEDRPDIQVVDLADTEFWLGHFSFIAVRAKHINGM